MKRGSYVASVVSAVAVISFSPFFLLTGGGSSALAAEEIIAPVTVTETVTSTATETASATETATTTAPPQPAETITATVTVTPDPLPVPTQTVTVTATPTISPGTGIIEYCEVTGVHGRNVQLVCYDEDGNKLPPGRIDNIVETIVDEVIVPGPTVTLPPLPRATVTERVPVPGETVTQEVEVRVPSEERTVFERFPIPGTIISVPGPTKTVTEKASPAPTVTITESPVVSPENEVDSVDDDGVLFDLPPLSTPEAVGIGALALLALCGLIILGLWLGYILGWKDKERREMKFLEALRDQFYYKGQHS